MEVRQIFTKEDLETILYLKIYKKKGEKRQIEVRKDNMRVVYFCTGMIGFFSLFLSCLYFIFGYPAILTKISWVIVSIYTLFSVLSYIRALFIEQAAQTV